MPTPDHLGDIFATLNDVAFQRCFVAWVAARTGRPESVIAIDGKTVRRSHHKKTGKVAIHWVSAFAACQRLVLGQVKVAAKSNEIIAIPKLSEMLEIVGAVVTIGAMGCQRSIAQKVIHRKADYMLASKGNQSAGQADVAELVAEQQAEGFKDTAISRHRTVNPDHGRIETRDMTVVHDVGWHRQRHHWPGPRGVVIVESTREIGDRIEKATRLHISSPILSAKLLGPMVRDHWTIENSVHWVLDMVFRDDESRVRTDHAPANFTTIEHTALNLFRGAKGRLSLRASRKTAAWNATTTQALSLHNSFNRFLQPFPPPLPLQGPAHANRHPHQRPRPPVFPARPAARRRHRMLGVR